MKEHSFNAYSPKEQISNTYLEVIFTICLFINRDIIHLLIIYPLISFPTHHSPKKSMDSPKHPQKKEKEEEIEDKAPSPPPPSAASPSHEFSFTIPRHSTPTSTTSLNISNNCTSNASTSLSTFELSPPDKIVLGDRRLGPLKSMSNAKASPPRHSNSSAENFTLPIDRIESDLSQRYSMSKASNRSETAKIKLKSISDVIFRFGNGRAKFEDTERGDNNKTTPNKKRMVLAQVLKKFANMVEQMFSYNRRERDRRNLQRRPHSFSIHSVPREIREGWRKRRGQRSAPASMKASPSNSGHFSTSSINKLSSSSDESTMEELQNAIQAAIAHCKSSIAAKGGQV